MIPTATQTKLCHRCKAAMSRRRAAESNFCSDSCLRETFNVEPGTRLVPVPGMPALSNVDVLVLKLPPVEWDEHAATLDDVGRQDTARSLTSLCAHVARVAGYFNAREIGRDHQTAVKESNNLTARVRKALGYSYPRDDLSF